MKCKKKPERAAKVLITISEDEAHNLLVVLKKTAATGKEKAFAEALFTDLDETLNSEEGEENE